MIGELNSSSDIVGGSECGTQFEIFGKYGVLEVEADVSYFKLRKTHEFHSSFDECRSKSASRSGNIGFIFIEGVVVDISLEEHQISGHRLADERDIYLFSQRQGAGAVFRSLGGGKKLLAVLRISFQDYFVVVYPLLQNERS